jgi:hypothetical protein
MATAAERDSIVVRPAQSACEPTNAYRKNLEKVKGAPCQNRLAFSDIELGMTSRRCHRVSARRSSASDFSLMMSSPQSHQS